MTSEALEQRYTLLIAAHDRPADLARLRRFLERQKAGFAVLVVEEGGNDLERYARGAEQVRTEYCSLCADSDLVLVDAIRDLLAFLAAHPDHAAAQGRQFGFSPAGEFYGISRPGASLDAAEPLDRLHQLFRNYEALTHAVHRTEVLRTALAQAKDMPHAMFAELAGGAIPAALGKVARLPPLHYGYSLSSRRQWDPAEFLFAGEPLLLGYRAYREALVRAGRLAPEPGDPAAAWRLLDLIHLRYLSERFRPRVIEAAIGARRRGLDAGEALAARADRFPLEPEDAARLAERLAGYQ